MMYGIMNLKFNGFPSNLV